MPLPSGNTKSRNNTSGVCVIICRRASRIVRAVADAPWDDALLADVAAVRCEDFEIIEESERDIDASLDLLAIAVRP